MLNCHSGDVLNQANCIYVYINIFTEATSTNTPPASPDKTSPSRPVPSDDDSLSHKDGKDDHTYNSGVCVASMKLCQCKPATSHWLWKLSWCSK